jgi:large subunit ribosomal protein L24
MTKLHVKKDDSVFVLTGKNAGKTGKVLKVYSDESRVIVEGVNMSVKHKKPRGRNQQGGIIHQESAISSSNVMLVCGKCKRPSKTGHKSLRMVRRSASAKLAARPSTRFARARSNGGEGGRKNVKIARQVQD